MSRDNNFQLIRFIAAAMVLFSHSFAVMGSKCEPLRNIVGLTFAELAVDIFFIVSGFLVTSSLLRRKSFFSFLWARILRIYPALIINALFCTFVIGLSFTSFPLIDYLASNKIYSFLLTNSLVLKVNIDLYLPGVFETNAYKGVVNGSTWTLPWEIKAYSILTLFSFVWWSRKELIVPTVAVMSIIILLIHQSIGIFGNSVYLDFFRFSSFFFVGSTLYIYSRSIPLSRKYLLLSLIVLLLSIILNVFFFAYVLLLPYIVISLAYVIGGFIRKFNKLGDYSYGMYLFAFPIQQSIYHLFPTINIIGMFISAFSVTLLFAIASWHLIEKKCLSLKRPIE